MIRVTAKINKNYLHKFNIKDLQSLIAFFADKKKVIDTQTQKVRTLKNIDEYKQFECKSASAAVLALFDFAKLIFLQSDKASYFHHVAALSNNTIIDLTTQQVLYNLNDYFKIFNIKSTLIL
jgi:hypothetical protein